MLLINTHSSRQHAEYFRQDILARWAQNFLTSNSAFHKLCTYRKHIEPTHERSRKKAYGSGGTGSLILNLATRRR